jgi:hypothetical protein
MHTENITIDLFYNFSFGYRHSIQLCDYRVDTYLVHKQYVYMYKNHGHYTEHVIQHISIYIVMKYSIVCKKCALLQICTKYLMKLIIVHYFYDRGFLHRHI